MIVLLRGIGDQVVIEDVVLTVVSVAEESVEVELQRKSGGDPVTVRLEPNKPVDSCYETRIVFLSARSDKARIGFAAHESTMICRREVWKS